MLNNNSLCCVVNEESEDDEGYGSIAGYDPNKYRKSNISIMEAGNLGNSPCYSVAPGTTSPE